MHEPVRLVARGGGGEGHQKIYKCLLHQIMWETMFLLANNVHGKHHRKSRQM